MDVDSRQVRAAVYLNQLNPYKYRLDKRPYTVQLTDVYSGQVLMPWVEYHLPSESYGVIWKRLRWKWRFLKAMEKFIKLGR
jgi:hypothetical protein